MNEASQNGHISTSAAPKRSAKKASAKKASAKRTAKKGGGDATLAEVAVAYLAHMTKSGKRETSIAAYEKDLELAVEVLGNGTPLSKITPAMVAEFFVHPLVVTTKTGRVKARPTIDRTRRVFRLAVTWAESEGMITNVPLPEAEPKTEPAPKPALKKRNSKATAKKSEPTTMESSTKTN